MVNNRRDENDLKVGLWEYTYGSRIHGNRSFYNGEYHLGNKIGEWKLKRENGILLKIDYFINNYMQYTIFVDRIGNPIYKVYNDSKYNRIHSEDYD